MFEMGVVVRERIAGMGRLAIYALVQTPGGTWLSFVLNKDGTFALERSIKPATTASAIPPLALTLLKQRITDSLARGDYKFVIGVFHAGDRITPADWRAKAIYSSEATITLR